MSNHRCYVSAMTDNTISCPKCGAEIPLTEAVSHRLREELAADFEKKRTELNAAMTRREEQIAVEKEALAQREKSVQGEVSKRVDAEKARLLATATREAEEKLGIDLKDLRTQLTEQQAKLKDAQTAELELRKKQRKLEEAKAAMELEMARKLDEERQKIADAARQQGADAERLKVADKDNIIKGLQEQIASLQQRAEQGSMQLQGETLELELENQLRAAFPFDGIAEIKKGARGGDVTQSVRTNSGFACGNILWEAKRAKKWSGNWPDKLKADQRAAKAELAVIVTTCPPERLRGMAQVDGVWVCEPLFAVALATALRQGLIATAAQRVQDSNRGDKMVAIYDHLCSVEFRQHVEAIVDSFLGLKAQLESEQRAFAKQWKERGQQLQKAVNHTAMLYGGIQGIAGREALPEIRTLQLTEAGIDRPSARGALHEMPAAADGDAAE